MGGAAHNDRVRPQPVCVLRKVLGLKWQDPYSPRRIRSNWLRPGPGNRVMVGGRPLVPWSVVGPRAC